MAQPVIQPSFSAGELAPALYARVDLARYHTAAALVKNWFVDYRGGVSTRPGTKYVLQAYKSATVVRLIGFQASFTVGYILEFGQQYIRFFNNGSPVLEAAKNITGATQANPGVITAVAHGYSTGDWGFIENVGGMTQLNNDYYIIQVTGANTFTLTDLKGNAINTTTFGAYTSGGTIKRVYTIPSPYQGSDLALLKFAQNVNRLYLCHPSYPPAILELVSATNWTLSNIQFGSAVAAPTGVSVATTLAGGTVNYSYTVTAVDANGQESAAATPAALASKTDLRTVAGTNRITWNAVTGAVRYNVYKAELSYTNAVASGAAHGFIGFTTSATFDDSNIEPDFTEAPPISKNPFQGSGVESITVTAAGTYTTVPTVTLGAPAAGGVQATATAVLQVQSATSDGVSGGTNWAVGDLAYFWNFSTGAWLGVVGVVATLTGGRVATFQPMTFPGSVRGSVTSGSVAPNPVNFGNNPNSGLATKVGSGSLTWGVGIVNVLNQGAGYTAPPSVTFSAGAATATANLASSLGGNPFVPQFAWQRLAFLGQSSSPQRFDMSRPGLYNNFDISNPIQPDDAISGTLVSKELNEIKSAIPMPSGLIIFSNKAAWLLYGASPGQAATAVDVTAQPQAYVGSNDVPPIVANDNILYVQAKGASVRNLSYNFYTNVYTGTDISVTASHLFFGFAVSEWAWAEEPYKVAWMVRNDGDLVSLTFLKEQEMIGWAQHNTAGTFLSVATVTETTGGTHSDAIYLAVTRNLSSGNWQYIERMDNRDFTNFTDPWCVDSGLRYSGAPATNFSGLKHLAGKDVVGLADGAPFNATVSADGTFTLSSAASLVTVGLQYVPDFQTLPLDLGNPTVQGKEKKITGVTLRCQDAMALSIGQTFDSSSQVLIKDLVLGNVGTMSNAVVTDLVTGDARQVIDPDWTVPGQYCVRQALPYPATILGVIPEVNVGDDK